MPLFNRNKQNVNNKITEDLNTVFDSHYFDDNDFSDNEYLNKLISSLNKLIKISRR